MITEQLGLGTQDSHCSPQLVPLQRGSKPTAVFCGTDCTVIITNTGAVLGTGSNRCNTHTHAILLLLLNTMQISVFLVMKKKKVWDLWKFEIMTFLYALEIIFLTISLFLFPKHFPPLLPACLPSPRHNKLGLDPVSEDLPLSNLSISSASSSTSSSSSTIGPASTCSSSSSTTIGLSDDNLQLGTENSDDDTGTPAILKLAGNLRHVDLSRQSFIMSSVFKPHGSEMADGSSRGAPTTDVLDSQEAVYKNGGLVPSVSSHIDKVSLFCLSGSDLLQEKVVTAALGTNHSAFVKGGGCLCVCVCVEGVFLCWCGGRGMAS